MICHDKFLFPRKPTATARPVHRLSSSRIAHHKGSCLKNTGSSAPKRPVFRKLARKRPAQGRRSRLTSIDCRQQRAFILPTHRPLPKSGTSGSGYFGATSLTSAPLTCTPPSPVPASPGDHGDPVSVSHAPLSVCMHVPLMHESSVQGSVSSHASVLLV